MTATALYNSVLVQAIEGHLVPQLDGEEDATILLNRVRKRKAQLVKEKKGKEDKPFEPIKESEFPIDLPRGWTFCRLGELGFYKKGPFGSALTKSMFVPKSSESVKVYEQKNAIQKDYSLGDYYITREYFEKMRGFEVRPGDIIVSCAGTIGETFVIPQNAPVGIINQALMRVTLADDSLTDYWRLFFEYVLISSSTLKGNGSAIKNIPPFDILKNIVIPLPPIEEQRRIVDKIKAILPLIDKFGNSQEELNNLNKTLSDKLRKSVLHEAIHGNLVPNDIPEGDATASELLQQILKERQDRENKAKGKKAKKLALSTIDEEPWELPEGWCWTKIGDIFDHSAGKSLNSSKQSIGKVYPYLTTSNVYWEGINFDKVKEMAFTEEEYEKCSAIKNDILVCEGGDVGRSCIWTYEYSIGLQNHVHRLRAVKNTDVKYFNYVLRFYKSAGIITAKGIGIGGFSANALKALSVPLPPLSIQHRIVEKIEEVFAAIDKLQE